MYDDIETKASYRHLQEIVSKLEKPACIIGGWAVFFTVNEIFEKETGRTYLGSRDIDVGFETAQAFKETGELLEKMGFRFLKFRYFKSIHKETGKELSPEEEKKLLIYEISKMWVDPFVPVSDEGIVKELGFSPLDEPLLKHVFSSKENRTELFDGKLLLPVPWILLGTKLNCLPGRDKRDKVIKDICDITALCLFAPGEMDEHISKAKEVADKSKLGKLKVAFSDERIKASAEVLGLDEAVVRGVAEKIVGS